MDLAKKKGGISLITYMIFLTMSTGVVFASGTNPRAGTDQFDYEQNLQQVYDEIERNNARQEKEFRENSAEIFLIYEQYGLTYNKETDRLYYNNELVRYFEDNQNTDGTFYGTVFPNTDGNIDVHAVRDSARKLIGLEPYSQDEFDARSLKMQDNGSNATVSGGLVNKSPKSTN